MIRVGLCVIVLLMSVLVSAQGGEAAVDIGVSIGDEGVQSFYLAIGNYFSVPQSRVVVIKERQIPDDELSVVFYLAKRAHVRPEVIVDMRLRGMTWMDITLHYRLSPEIYYVPVKGVVVTGPPYGNAYGHYKNKPKKQWKTIRLTDGDVVNLVNLRFISEHHHYAPEKVIQMRGEGRSFIVIHDDADKQKKEHGEGKGPQSSKEKKGKQKGKGKQEG